jgi:hypothetical protein
MLLSKAQLRAVACASSEAVRPNLNGLHVSADGTATATDGHVLLQVTVDREANDEAEYPKLCGLTPMTPDAQLGVIIPTAACLAAAKDAPKRHPHPLLVDNVMLARNGSVENAVLASTDLDTVKRQDFRPVEGPYPRVETVFQNGDPVLVIDFRPRVLADYFKAIADVLGAKADDGCVVRLAFHGPLKACEVTGNRNGVHVRGLMMPARLPDEGRS